MIVGTLLEPASNMGGNSTNGATSVVFYTEREAVAWCLAMSDQVSYGGAYTINCVTVMYNTETGIKRWWYAGTEYTG